METGGKITWVLEADASKLVAALKSADNQAASTAKTVDNEFKNLGDSVAKSLKSAGDKLTTFGNTMTVAVSLPLVKGFKDAIKVTGDFQTTIKTAGVVSNATAGELQEMAARARELGADLSIPGVTAQDAADAMLELVKAGMSTEDTMAAMKDALYLAAAGGMATGEAAVFMTTSLNAFKIPAKNAARVSDVLANAANLSTASLHDLTLGMSQASLVAASAGISIEDTATALALFANNGLRGSDAGTSLKTMMLQIQTPSKQAAGIMGDFADKLGLASTEANKGKELFYDLDGRFVGLAEAGNRLKKATEGMTDAQKQNALGVIFGSDAIRAATLLASTAGDEWESLAGSIDTQGEAARVATQRMGEWDKSVSDLKKTWQEFQLTIGPDLIESLKGVLQNVMDMVNWFKGLSPEQQKAIVNFGLFLAVLGPIASVVGRLMTIFAGLSAVMGGLINLVKGVGGAFKLISLGMSGAMVSGGPLVKLFTGIGKALAPVASVLGTVGKAISTFLVGPIGKLVTSIIPKLLPMLGFFGSVLARVFTGPIGWITIIVQLLVGLFAWLYNTFDGFRAFVDGIAGAIGGFFAGIGKWFSEAAANVGNFFAGIGKSIGEFFVGVGNWFAQTAQQVANFFAPVVAVIATVFDVIWRIVSGIFIAIVAILAMAAEAFFTYIIMPIVNLFVGLWNTLVGIFTNIVLGIQAVLITIGTWIFENVITPVVNFFIGLWNSIVAIFTGLWNGIVAIVQGIVASIIEFFTPIVQWYFDTIITPVANFFVGLWNGIVSGVSAAVQMVKNVWNTITGWIDTNIIKPIAGFFTGLWNGIVSGINGMVEGIKSTFNTIVGIVKTPINGIIDGINGVIDGVNSLKVPDWVPGLGGQSPNIPKIPKLATGGIVEAVNGGQIIRAGEAGDDEWVIPERKMASLINQINDRMNTGNYEDSRSGNVTNVYHIELPNVENAQQFAREFKLATIGISQ